MGCLIIRLEAPLLSFGGTVVDQHHPTEDWPLRSQLAGMIANALGFRHGEFQRLSALQRRLVLAVCEDRKGRPLRDYQTVDLGQDFLVDGGWTTRGVREDRGKGAATKGTHIRYRHHVCDANYRVALRLDPADEDPDLAAIEQAFAQPARPLFIGRKPCLPSQPMLLPPGDNGATSGSSRDTDDLVAALAAESPDPSCRLWHQDADHATGQQPLERTESRDWRAQMHVGRDFWWATTCAEVLTHV